MDISFIPSPDVAVIINAILDKFENRIQRNTQHSLRSIKIILTDIPLPSYFSQTDPGPRLIANDQLTQLERANLLNLTWLPGETGHLLQSVGLQTEHAKLYPLLNREPKSTTRSRLETLLLANQFRFSRDDWQGRAIHRTLTQLRAGKSPAPFSLTDTTWNLDLLDVLSALPTLEAEMAYRVFSVRTFNDSKRFDELKPAIVRLARLSNPEWKAFTTEDILRELNLVANPNYIHIAGNWQLTTQTGEILSLGGFTPSVGFPAAQIETIQAVTVYSDSILCIENLTSFHEYLRANATRPTPPATLCIMGNPSPPIRRLLRLIPEKTPIYLWSDMDFGGFNILSQLRKRVCVQIQPYLMDIPTFENHAHLAHPLTQMDVRKLKNLCSRPELADVKSTIEHLIHRGLKLEQEAIQT
jgi:hypothetical protein